MYAELAMEKLLPESLSAEARLTVYCLRRGQRDCLVCDWDCGSSTFPPNTSSPMIKHAAVLILCPIESRPTSVTFSGLTSACSVPPLMMS